MSHSHHFTMDRFLCQNHPFTAAKIICFTDNHLLCEDCSKLALHYDHEKMTLEPYLNSCKEKLNACHKHSLKLEEFEKRIKNISKNSLESVLTEFLRLMQNSIRKRLIHYDTQEWSMKTAHLSNQFHSLKEGYLIGNYKELLQGMENQCSLLYDLNLSDEAIESVAQEFTTELLNMAKSYSEVIPEEEQPLIKDYDNFVEEPAVIKNNMKELEMKVEDEKDVLILTDFEKINRINIKVGRDVKSISAILSSLEILKELTGLSISLNGNANVNDLTFQSLGSLINLLPKLRELNLDVSHCKGLAFTAFDTLSVSYFDQNLLEKIHMNFKYCDTINDQSMDSLVMFLEKTKYLKELSLNFSHTVGAATTIGDDGIKKLAAFLKKHELTRLSLSFSNCRNISDAGLQELSSSLSLLRSLKSLELVFSGCGQITNNGIQTLSSCLYSLNFLEELYFDFGFIKRIDDLSLLVLSSPLQNCYMIKKLHLSFVECRGITDTGLDSLCWALTNLPFLESLILDLRFCHSLKDSCLENLTSAVKTLSQLKNVQFHLTDCQSLTKSKVEKFKSSFDNNINVLVEI